MAWWGKGHPPVGHIMSEGPHVNSIVCHPQDEETMVAQESTGWINYLCKLKPKGVMDLYSETGECGCRTLINTSFDLLCVLI